MVKEKLRQVRGLFGYSQEFMAERLEMSQSQYSRFEGSASKVGADRLKRIATVFGLTVDELRNFEPRACFGVGLAAKERARYETRIRKLEERVEALRKKKTKR